MIFSILSIFTGAALVLFALFSMSCALYFFSEAIEENCVSAKKWVSRIITTVIGIHVLLWAFDGLPALFTAFSIFCHWVYRANMHTFPFMSLRAPLFISGCALAVANHFLWFYHFNFQSLRSQSPSLFEITAFFVACVWLVPVALFLSMTASDLVIPYGDSDEQKQARLRNSGQLTRGRALAATLFQNALTASGLFKSRRNVLPKHK